MQIENVDASVGAIATGVDARHLSKADWEVLYQAWLDRGVLVVRGQKLDIEQFLGLGERFGRVKPHRVRRTRHKDYPQLTVMGEGTRKPDGTTNKSIYDRGLSWHTDGPWDDEPCKATMLYGLEIPSFGGDTLFTSMYDSYDALPAAMKEKLKGVSAEYVYGGWKKIAFDLLEPEDQRRPPTIYPLIRKHPETGRESLYFNPFHVLRIHGFDEAASKQLIEELTAVMVVPDSEYRHKWQVGDVVVWDNRCTLHSATGGYPIEERRIHWRCTIMEPGTTNGARVPSLAAAA